MFVSFQRRIENIIFRNNMWTANGKLFSFFLFLFNSFFFVTFFPLNSNACKYVHISPGLTFTENNSFFSETNNIGQSNGNHRWEFKNIIYFGSKFIYLCDQLYIASILIQNLIIFFYLVNYYQFNGINFQTTMLHWKYY